MKLSTLEHAAIGSPITRAGVSFFPVYLPGVVDVGVSVASESSLMINEHSSATVPTVSVTCTGSVPTLLVQGEIVVGGQQNRALNVDVIVGAGTSLDVPVSCVEAGRWGGESGFERGRTHASRRVRRALASSVTESAERNGERTSNQHSVWHTVDAELNRLGVGDARRSFVDADLHLDRDGLGRAVAELSDSGPLPHQCGVVVTHGQRVVAAELFASTRLLAGYWSPMVRSHLLEASGAPTRRPSAAAVLAFLRGFGTTSFGDTEGVGLGREHHFRSSRVAAQALTLDGDLVHAFALAC